MVTKSHLDELGVVLSFIEMVKHLWRFLYIVNLGYNSKLGKKNWDT